MKNHLAPSIQETVDRAKEKGTQMANTNRDSSSSPKEEKPRIEGFQGFESPNTIDTPNQWYYEILPRLKHISEIKVVSYVIAKTLGWNKWWEWISLEQFENGQKGIDVGCGLSMPAILDGIKLAEEDKLIETSLRCPRCGEFVERTEKEERPWINRYGEGTKIVDVVPDDCPHCGNQLRGYEQLWVRLAFINNIVRDYGAPRDFMARYGKKGGPRNESAGDLENSSHKSAKRPKQEKKLENSRSPSLTTLPSQEPSQTTTPPSASSSFSGHKTSTPRKGGNSEKKVKAKKERFLPRTPAAEYYRNELRRAGDRTTVFGNATQREKFETAEKKCGLEVMKGIIDWAIVTNVRGKTAKIISAANNPKNHRDKGGASGKQQSGSGYRGQAGARPRGIEEVPWQESEWKDIAIGNLGRAGFGVPSDG